MIKSLVLLFALVATSTASMAAEGCGDRQWRDINGYCHWFKNGYGPDRGTTHACPTWAFWSAGRCVPR
jgi:hypothetical protein